MSTRDYFDIGASRARHLGSRGPLRFESGRLHPEIRNSYREHGFYVLEGVIDRAEVNTLINGFDELLDQAPAGPDDECDKHGRPVLGGDFSIPTFTFAKPSWNPIKQAFYGEKTGVPGTTLSRINRMLYHVEPTLHLYGHPDLLRVAEGINGEDFVPGGDMVWIKEPWRGAGVNWHQDGSTLFDSPKWEPEVHGFNIMAQLYRATPTNALWVVPGSHKLGKIDVAAYVKKAGTPCLPDAVPILCEPGDVAICNRQALHGSFPNLSPNPRITITYAFHKRAAVEGSTFRLGERAWTYTAERIEQRACIVALAIDARSQKYPTQDRYNYQPFSGREEENVWSEETREKILKNYSLYNIGL